MFNSKRLLRAKFSCMILVLSPQTRKKKWKKKMRARNFYCQIYTWSKGNFESYELFRRGHPTLLLSHGLKDKTFCRLFSLNAKHCTLSRAEQDLPLHHWQLIIKSNIIFSNRTYASASFKLHFLPVRSISVNQTAFRNLLIAAVFQHSSWNG